MQNRDHVNTKQGEGQVTIEQDSPRNKDDEEDDQETHHKGYRLKPEK